MCKILVEGGCDVSITDANGKMASQIAKRNNQLQTFQYLNNVNNKKKMENDSANDDIKKNKKKEQQPKQEKE